MRRTDQQIITQIRTLIGQTDSSNSDFTDAELLGFANEGQQFIATRIEWPRDIISIQVEEGVPAYTLPNDLIKVRTAYFGDTSVNGDICPIPILLEEQLRDIVPGWLDQNSAARGAPTRCAIIDRATIIVSPTPDAASAATGKKLHLGYVYFPAAMAGAGDYPDLPDNFHDEIKFYAGHLCYMGKLKNPTLATSMLDMMIKKLDLMKPSVVDQVGSLVFQWVDYDGESNSGDIANNRLV